MARKHRCGLGCEDNFDERMALREATEDEPTAESLRAKQERGEEITMADVPKSICELLLDVLIEHGLHTPVPRGIKPPPLVVALYETAAAYYQPIIDSSLGIEQLEIRDDLLKDASAFLASVASAQSQGTREQTDWMIAQAREGLRRVGGHDFDAASDDVTEPSA